jgi:Zn-dependent protease with chaperone function
MSAEHGTVAWGYVGTRRERFETTAVLATLWIVAALRYVVLVICVCVAVVLLPLFFADAIVIRVSGTESLPDWYNHLELSVFLIAAAIGVVAVIVLLPRRRRRYEESAFATFEARPLDEPEATLMRELLEELAIAAGCTAPRALVVDSDAMNAMSIGAKASAMTIVVTAGLFELPRPELEAVLAYELALIASGEVRVTVSIVALTSGWDASWLRLGLRTWALRCCADHRDRVARSFTRNPEALVSAFEAIAEDPGVPPGLTVEDVPLWLEFPPEMHIPFNDRHVQAIRDAVSLDRRIAALEAGY